MEPNAVQAAWNRDYVYCVGMAEHHSNNDLGLKLCKIGRAHNINSRMAQLQTGNPYQLYLIASCLSQDAVGLELSLHQQYAENRVQGEWFELTQGDIMAVERIMSENV